MTTPMSKHTKQPNRDSTPNQSVDPHMEHQAMQTSEKKKSTEQAQHAATIGGSKTMTLTGEPVMSNPDELQHLPQPLESPQPIIIRPQSRESPRRCKIARKQLHGETLAGRVYLSLLEPTLKSTWGEETRLYDDTCATSVLNAGDFIRSMKPRDAMEELLLSQVLWIHGRIASLTQRVATEEEMTEVERLNGMIERAHNTFRRQMLTLAEYRRPAAVRGSGTSIKQANIAGQQIIMNQEARDNENTTNEQGCPAVPIAGSLPAKEQGSTLPFDPSGTRITQSGGPTGAAMATIDRAQNS